MDSLNWRPERVAAMERLQDFLPRAGHHYKANRTTDPGPGLRDGVSGLSPWLRHRVLLEEEVVAATLRHHGFRSAEKFLQEVCWRTYWKGWLELRPSVWCDYREEVRQQAEALDADRSLAARYLDAVHGRTGIACMDAWVEELVSTGYLHNHARMWFASIWVFTLGLPWTLGADFFLRHLLDGDPASNTLSWRWVAGLHTPGKTYLARADNIHRHTRGRFSPSPGELAQSAAPVGRPVDSSPQPAPGGDRCPPEAALLLHEDDLALPGSGEGVPGGEGLAVMRVTAARSPMVVSPAVDAFARGVCLDARDRAAAASGRTAGDIIEGDAVAEKVVAWARQTGMRSVVTPWAPRGPVAELLEEAGPMLADCGIRLHRVVRYWDATCWPHATRGFFAFWKPVSRSLRAGELTG